MNGQQTVTFQDGSHVSSTVYGMAYLVNEEDKKNLLNNPLHPLLWRLRKD